MTKHAPARTVRFGGDETISPLSMLDRAIFGCPDEHDPIARAPRQPNKQARFHASLDWDYRRLEAARQAAHEYGLNIATCQTLRRVARDLKGEAAALGCPLIASVATSLCCLIDHARDKSTIPLALIDQHIDAAGALMDAPSWCDGDAGRAAQKLACLAADFLMEEDVVALADFDQMASPPLVPRLG